MHEKTIKITYEEKSTVIEAELMSDGNDDGDVDGPPSESIQELQETIDVTTAIGENSVTTTIMETTFSGNEYINHSFLMDTLSQLEPELNIESISLHEINCLQPCEQQNSSPAKEESFKDVDLEVSPQIDYHRESESDKDPKAVKKHIFKSFFKSLKINWEMVAKVYKLLLAIISTFGITCGIFLVKQALALAASDMAIVKFAVQLLLCIPLSFIYKESLLGKNNT
jgi:hypothetical protein